MPEQTQQEVKKWYQSKTIWASLISIIAIIYSFITGHHISSETQQAVTNNVYQIVSYIVAIAGAIGAIIGRLKADKIIK